MGSDIADINGDGRLDFMVADMAGTTHFRAKTTMGEMSGLTSLSPREWLAKAGDAKHALR